MVAEVPLDGGALPASLLSFVVSSREALVLCDQQRCQEFAPFKHDAYYAAHCPQALLCLPILKAGEVFGVLYLESDFSSNAFTSSHVQLLQLLCGQAALSIDNARLYSQISTTNSHLETLVSLRTSELESTRLALECADKAKQVKADFLSNMRSANDNSAHDAARSVHAVCATLCTHRDVSNALHILSCLQPRDPYADERGSWSQSVASGHTPVV